jgi:hypothetical protein
VLLIVFCFGRGIRAAHCCLFWEGDPLSIFVRRLSSVVRRPSSVVRRPSCPFFLFLAWRPSWLEVGITGHNFKRGPSKDHSTKVWLQLVQWFLRRRFVCEFPIGSYVKLSFSSETTEPISTKFCWNDPWVVPFQNGVHHVRSPAKLAAIGCGFWGEDFYVNFP